MNIEVFENQATISIQTLDVSDNYIEIDYLIDTGFTGKVIFTVNKKWDLFKIFKISNLVLLENKNWIALANGKQVKTFSAEIFMVFHDYIFTLSILIIESESEEEKFEPPLIGMKFLQFMKSHLSLDFKNNTFSLT